MKGTTKYVALNVLDTDYCKPCAGIVAALTRAGLLTVPITSAKRPLRK